MLRRFCTHVLQSLVGLFGVRTPVIPGCSSTAPASMQDAGLLLLANSLLPLCLALMLGPLTPDLHATMPM